MALSWNEASRLSLMTIHPTSIPGSIDVELNWGTAVEGTGFEKYEIYFGSSLATVEAKGGTLIDEGDYAALGVQSTISVRLLYFTPIGFNPSYENNIYLAVFGKDTVGGYTSDSMSLGIRGRIATTNVTQLSSVAGAPAGVEVGDVEITYSTWASSGQTLNIWAEFLGPDGNWYPCTSLIFESGDTADAVTFDAVGGFTDDHKLYWHKPSLDYQVAEEVTNALVRVVARL